MFFVESRYANLTIAGSCAVFGAAFSPVKYGGEASGPSVSACIVGFEFAVIRNRGIEHCELA